VLQGKVAWITGAGSGIGRSGALELSAGGARVVLSGRRGEQLDKVAAEIEAAGGTAGTAPLDVADKAAVAKVAAGILDRHGRVDILVNSATASGRTSPPTASSKSSPSTSTVRSFARMPCCRACGRARTGW